MEIKINDVTIHYIDEGNKEQDAVLILHGWGQEIATMQRVHDALKHTHRVVTIDFPGFGKSPEPSRVYSVYDYTSVIESLVLELELRNLTIIGHSFGGRIGIIYASRNTTLKKLILVDSAGILPKRGFSYYRRVYMYKTLKQFLKLPILRSYEHDIKKKFGSSDYQSASPRIRQIMIGVVNEDLQPLLSKILVPTLLFWGDLDDATPLSDAQIMEKEIPNAGLVVAKGAGHYSFLEQFDLFYRVVASFLESDTM